MSKIFGKHGNTLPEDCRYVISPSQISKFFEYPKQWYLENVKKSEPEFKGNTASFIGTICHYIYESYINGEKTDRKEINEDLKQYLIENPNADVDYYKVINTYPEVAMSVMNNYVVDSLATDIKVEQKVHYQLRDGIYVAGTYDRLESNTILCDFKTVGTKPNEWEIPFHYRIQLLAYVYILNKLGYNIEKIRIIYGVKPTKTLPARTFVVTEDVTDESLKLIEDTLNLISDSILTCEQKPELTYLIFKSMELKDVIS